MHSKIHAIPQEVVHFQLLFYLLYKYLAICILNNDVREILTKIERVTHIDRINNNVALKQMFSADLSFYKTPFLISICQGTMII